MGDKAGGQEELGLTLEFQLRRFETPSGIGPMLVVWRRRHIFIFEVLKIYRSDRYKNRQSIRNHILYRVLVSVSPFLWRVVNLGELL